MFRGLEIEQKKRFRRLCLNWGDVDLLQKVVPDDENAGLIVFSMDEALFLLRCCNILTGSG